jgi:hypothetical protein
MGASPLKGLLTCAALPDLRLTGDGVFYRRVQGKEAVEGLADGGTQAAGGGGPGRGGPAAEPDREACGGACQGGRAGLAARASPTGAVTVPPWQDGAEASALPRAYQDLLEVAADAGRPLRAGEFAAAAGLATDKAKVEGLRSKLKPLAAPGWLAGVPGGLFTLPDHSGKEGNPDGNGFFVLGSKVLLHPTSRKKNPSWQRTAQYLLMIRSPRRRPCSTGWPPSSPARLRPA